MRRRAALGTLFALSAVAVPVVQGAEAAAGDVLLWDAAGLWVAQADGVVQTLAGAAGVPVPPVVVDSGLWALAGRRRMLRWRRGVDGAWAVAAEHQFDEPVLALAASVDGRFALAAHGERLTLLDAAGVPLRRYEGTDLGHRRRGRARALFHLPTRSSFVAAWPELGELWEISLDPTAPPVFDGLVHDYRMGEAIATPGYLGVRRAPLGMPMADISFADGRVPWVAGALGEQVQVVHLDVRRPIAQWRLPDARPAAAALRRDAGAWNWWLPAGHAVHVIESARWQVTARHALPGPVQALQALDDAVWALVGEGAALHLGIIRAGAWAPVDLPAGRPCALCADSTGARVLVAAGEPPRLHELDPDGRVLRVWQLAGAGRPLGVRALGGTS